MFILKQDKEKTSDIDSIYRIICGDIKKHILNNYDKYEIKSDDIKDIYIFTSYDEEVNKTYVFISVNDDLDLIYVSETNGSCLNDKNYIIKAVRTWIKN